MSTLLAPGMGQSSAGSPATSAWDEFLLNPIPRDSIPSCPSFTAEITRTSASKIVFRRLLAPRSSLSRPRLPVTSVITASTAEPRSRGAADVSIQVRSPSRYFVQKTCMSEGHLRDGFTNDSLEFDAPQAHLVLAQGAGPPGSPSPASYLTVSWYKLPGLLEYSGGWFCWLCSPGRKPSVTINALAL